jgi:hypothetical protein
LRRPRLTRQRSFAFLNWRRRLANSALTFWIVSAPMCPKHFVAPLESLSRSNPLSQRAGPEYGRAAL